MWSFHLSTSKTVKVAAPESRDCVRTEFERPWGRQCLPPARPNASGPRTSEAHPGSARNELPKELSRRGGRRVEKPRRNSMHLFCRENPQSWKWADKLYCSPREPVPQRSLCVWPSWKMHKKESGEDGWGGDSRGPHRTRFRPQVQPARVAGSASDRPWTRAASAVCVSTGLALSLLRCGFCGCECVGGTCLL